MKKRRVREKEDEKHSTDVEHFHERAVGGATCANSLELDWRVDSHEGTLW